MWRSKSGFCTILFTCLAVLRGDAEPYRVVGESIIAEVPSWFPVDFSLMTHNDKHFVAYYDAAHEMTVAECRVGQNSWKRSTLPSRVGWDSHNYVTLAADSTGQLHLSGNMHGVPLTYFRTTRQGDSGSFAPAAMVGRDERHCTYPVILTDAEQNLFFLYRDGGSGNGSNIVNRYDAATQRWSRFLDEPLFDGESDRNAYPLGPVKGPDGRFHIVWVWRDTPDCATNHHLSYARSPDLKHWETAAGNAIELPLRLDQSEAYIDPIPSGGGIINGCEKLIFDSQLRPVIAYHKSDANGNMQIYVARFEEDQWQIRAVTEWDQRVEFGGYGSMPFIGIEVSGLRRLDENNFVLDYRHRDYGQGSVVLDELILEPTDEHPPIKTVYPADLLQPESDWPGMEVRIAEDSSTVENAGKKYVLRWETLETNQDKPRDPPLPPPSQLKLIELQRS